MLDTPAATARAMVSTMLGEVVRADAADIPQLLAGLQDVTLESVHHGSLYWDPRIGMVPHVHAQSQTDDPHATADGPHAVRLHHTGSATCVHRRLVGDGWLEYIRKRAVAVWDVTAGMEGL